MASIGDRAHRRALFFAIVFVSAIATLAIAPRPIAQDQRYHHFADTRSVLGVPNFGNTASNIIFVLAGVAGLASLRRMAGGMTPRESLGPAVTFCIGAILTGVGSALYHWNPSDKLLIFDRLGLVVALAAFSALLMAHFDIPDAGVATPILLIAGVGSVLYWVYGGDLRPYGLFQGFPLILLGLGSVLFPRTHTHHAMLGLVAIGYLIAKVCESADRQIYALGGVVSGHTLKHLIAGVSIWMTVEWLRRRSPTAQSQ